MFFGLPGQNTVTCEVEYTDEFENWWNGLSEDEQDSVAAHWTAGGKGDAIAVSLLFRHQSVKTLAHARAACPA